MPSARSTPHGLIEPAVGSGPQAQPRPLDGPARPHPRQWLQRALDDLRGAMVPGQRLALLLLNLDKFRLVNDLCGPACGDLLLDMLERERLRALAGARTLHLEGDEFVCLLPFRDEAEVAAFTQRVQKVIGEPIWFGRHRIHLTASMGLVIAEEGSASADALLHAASLALTSARQEGGNAVRRFEPEMFVDLDNRAELEGDFERSLLRGEILPFYQPIVALGSSAINGFEALPRWEHHRQGLVSPDRFLPIVENMGLDRELLLMMLRRACSDARDWPPHFTVSVNISPAQLCEPGIALKILQVLFASGLAPGRLIIEITEESLVANVSMAEETMQSLRNAGVRIALDDFGTGYGSLSRLCHLAFDRLKIDRTLVQAIDHVSGRKLVKAVVDLGSSLSIPVTAEGIETREQVRFLQDVNCAFGQGYLFGRPVPAPLARQLAAG